MNNLNLFQELEKLLRMESKYCSEDGILLKNSIVESALAMRPDLIKILLSHDKIKKNFFTNIEGVMVFDKIQFQKFVMNKRFLPDSYTSFKNKIGLTNINGDFLSEKNEVVLSWPYKDCILEGGQTKEDAKRNEIFWNETLAPDDINRLTEPKVLSNFSRYDSTGKHEVNDFSEKDNLIIKGNNLLALHSLLEKYRGKIKLIYIDPPYNTGNDGFKYNDSFNHSSWLTFMRNRLIIARELLTVNGGFFCVQCDDNESAYLKIMSDEIFEKDNFLSTITIRSSTPSGLKTAHKNKTIIKTKDYIHIYKKGEIKIEPQYIQRTEWDIHYNKYLDKKNLKTYNLVDKLINEGILALGSKLKDVNIKDSNFKRFYLKNSSNIYRTQPEIPEKHKKESLKQKNNIYSYNHSGTTNYAFNGRRFSFLSESINKIDTNDFDLGILLCDIWTDIDFQNTQNEGGYSFPSGKKPEKLLYRLLNLFTTKGDIVLDYHLGSGTTAAVAHKMGRQYIGIEQMDYIENVAVERLKKVIGTNVSEGLFDKLEYDQSGISKAVNWQGGGSFVYCELAKANQNFIDQITNAITPEELNNIWNNIINTGFISWKVSPKTINEAAENFSQLCIDDMKKFLIEVLDKNLLYIPLADMNDINYNVTQQDKELNEKFYNKK